MGSTGSSAALCIMVVCCIGAFRSGYCFRVSWFPQAFANLRASLALMFSNWRHPRFRYFGFVVPVYVVWVIGLGYLLPLSLALCTNGCSVNKLHFVPQQLVSVSVSVFWNRGILSACESYVLVVFFYSFLHGSSRFSDVDFAACARSESFSWLYTSNSNWMIKWVC